MLVNRVKSIENEFPQLITADSPTQKVQGMASVSYTHLDVYKRQEYSLLDGACRIDRLMDKISALGQKAVAITDHGVMYGLSLIHICCRR